MTRSRRDNERFRATLRAQHGLFSVDQAGDLGVTRQILHRHTRGRAGIWQRPLPRVYAVFTHALTAWQWVIAAWLYAGPDAVVTGVASLRARGFRYLPSTETAVDVLVPSARNPRSRGPARIHRTGRMPPPVWVRGVPMAPVARAVVDACRQLVHYDAVLGVAAEAVQRRLATVDQLVAELALAPLTGRALLRRALDSLLAGARSVAEAKALEIFTGAGFPPALVNSPLTVDGVVVACPDFRWGWLIVEIDSKEWHLLQPGSWEATLRRRKMLERMGYEIVVVTPAELDLQPDLVTADVRARLQKHGILPGDGSI